MTTARMTTAVGQYPPAYPGGGPAVRARLQTRCMGGATNAQIPYAMPEAV